MWANSEKTADAIVVISHGRIRRSRIHVFYNRRARRVLERPAGGARPAALAGDGVDHPPPELTDALAILAERGIAVRWIGRGGEQVRVRPADLDAADAVVTIGKTVAFALAAGVPCTTTTGSAATGG